jgi:micrococcal nuclease
VKVKGLVIVLIASLTANLYLLFGNKIRNLETPGPTASGSGQTITVKVARIVDGDTFHTEDKRVIRLAGIDAPEEAKECLALKAKERLAELIEGKKVKIELTGEKSFDREVGFVFVKDAFIDKIMLEEGLGRATGAKDPNYGAVLMAAQDSAKKAQRGIWSDLCQGNGCLIKGNYRKDNDTYIYHLPDCYNYERIVVNEKERDQWFCTEEEAILAGFRKSEDCPADK